MSILTSDTDLSTDLLFVTPDVDPLTVFTKLSVVSLGESMTQIYLNGDKIEVGVRSLFSCPLLFHSSIY